MILNEIPGPGERYPTQKEKGVKSRFCAEFKCGSLESVPKWGYPQNGHFGPIWGYPQIRGSRFGPFLGPLLSGYGHLRANSSRNGQKGVKSGVPKRGQNRPLGPDLGVSPGAQMSIKSQNSLLILGFWTGTPLARETPWPWLGGPFWTPKWPKTHIFDQLTSNIGVPE